jgi:transposase InsO family protein
MEHPQTPFGTIALDFITKLPTSEENDTILTITDHDCSKATLFFACKETITAEQVAELYAKYIFPHYGIPRKVISDRDPRFTGRFTTTLCANLGIKQNLSTAYHPQTDGQSERTNQWLEQYLRIFGNYSQSDWANWLPLAQYVHNSWMNKTTKQTPFNLLIGGLPVSHYPMTEGQMTEDDRMDRIHEMRSRAQEAIAKAQDVMRNKKGTNYKPYQERDRV